jgi:hypothetical protein
LTADSLQSPDDWEATYRHKSGKDYVGYVANVTETSAPENPFQLIVKVQAESNNTDDCHGRIIRPFYTEADGKSGFISGEAVTPSKATNNLGRGQPDVNHCTFFWSLEQKCFSGARVERVGEMVRLRLEQA